LKTKSVRRPAQLGCSPGHLSPTFFPGPNNSRAGRPSWPPTPVLLSVSGSLTLSPLRLSLALSSRSRRPAASRPLLPRPSPGGQRLLGRRIASGLGCSVAARPQRGRGWPQYWAAGWTPARGRGRAGGSAVPPQERGAGNRPAGSSRQCGTAGRARVQRCTLMITKSCYFES
jgi:hypothetical protein